MHSFFGPASPQASAVAHLWWWMFGVGGAVWLAVIATLFYVIRAKRGQRESDDLLHLTPERESRLTRVVSAAVFVTCGLALGRPGAVAAAGGWLLVVLLLASQRPEGDLVVPGSTEGYVWLLGGMLVAGACIVPHYRTPARRPPDPPSADAEDGR